MKSFFVENTLERYWPYEPPAEADFSRQIVRCIRQLFPGYHGRSWTPIIRDGWGRGAQPDLVLVSSEFDLWYVVEVELAHHSLSTHIAPQLETLSRGIYDSSLVASLSAAIPEVPGAKLRELIYREPGFLCIADDYTSRIHSACREWNFELAVFEPYHSKTGGWAMNVARLPSVFWDRTEAERYQLRRGHIFGNREWMELPRQFPLWRGKIIVHDATGTAHECQVLDAQPPQISVPTGIVVPGRPIALVIVDRQRRIVRLEIDI
ncbi:MAG: hypothetical protein H0X40_18320 [Chthoniobacterales bacterium]|nr:hypothetical protein [Chthoniobacterales bacterium]